MSVFFYGCVTLDGCLADSRHGLDWLHETGTVEETGYEDFYRRMDVTLMGRRTFQALAEAGEPASFYPTTRNYVFTHRPLTQTGFTAVQGSVAAFVRQFSPKENLWVIGGGTLLAPLLEEDLLDHLILQIAPVLLGGGIPLFSQREGLRRFHLEDVRQYGQFEELVYRKS